jgi:hypothetical protein
MAHIALRNAPVSKNVHASVGGGLPQLTHNLARGVAGCQDSFYRQGKVASAASAADRSATCKITGGKRALGDEIDHRR